MTPVPAGPGPRIRVRYARDSLHRPGYQWTCSACPRLYGFHQFDRFTDRRLRDRAVHPWSRAMAAGRRHLLLAHLIPDAMATVAPGTSR